MTKALAGLSKDHPPGDVVVVSSIRNPPEGHNVTVARDVRYDTMSALANQIAAIGGSRDQFNRAAATEGADYNLVGWFDDPSAKSPRGRGPEWRMSVPTHVCRWKCRSTPSRCSDPRSARRFRCPSTDSGR